MRDREWERGVSDIESMPEVRGLVFLTNTSAQSSVLRGASKIANLSAGAPV